MAAAVGAIGIGSSLLGGLFGAAGAEQSAEAQSQALQYQSAVATINSNIELQNAEYARQQGEQQSQQYGMQAGQKFGAIKVAQASSGLDINSGSAKLVQGSERLVANLDLDQIRSNAAKTAYDYDVQATQYKNQAGLYTMGATNAAAAGPIAATSSILGAAGSVSSKWLQASNTGMFNNIPGLGG